MYTVLQLSKCLARNAASNLDFLFVHVSVLITLSTILMGFDSLPDGGHRLFPAYF